MLPNIQELARIQQREMLDQAEKRQQVRDLRQQAADYGIHQPQRLAILRRVLAWASKSADSELNTRTVPAVSTNRT
jgi:hypothetical protein